MIDHEFIIKPILVRVCGESVFGLNYNNSLSLWNFDEYFLKCRVRTSAPIPEQTFVVGETLNIQWKAEADFLAEPYKGSDAYETHDGLMAGMVSTFKGA